MLPVIIETRQHVVNPLIRMTNTMGARPGRGFYWQGMWVMELWKSHHGIQVLRVNFSRRWGILVLERRSSPGWHGSVGWASPHAEGLLVQFPTGSGGCFQEAAADQYFPITLMFLPLSLPLSSTFYKSF